MKPKRGGDGGWSKLTAEQKAERTRKMVETRRANRARAALPTEIEHLVVPIPGSDSQRPNGMGSLDDLADLIVAVWRKL